MDLGNSLGLGLFGNVPGRFRNLWLLGGHRLLAALGSGRDDQDGPTDSYRPPVPRSRGDDPGANGGAGSEGKAALPWDAKDVLGGIGMIGLLAYALIYGMDATISSMLTGLFGVLVGRSTKNGTK